MARRGIFITLEGPDGAGKSTQARLLKAAFRRLGRSVVLTKEPGGSKASAEIRELVLGAEGDLSPAAELLLFLADRAQHVADTLAPALKAGKVVLCDRYADSTLAYQGGGRGFKNAAVIELNRFATGDLKPDLTLLFDLAAPHGLKRAKKRGTADRMERAGAEFHARVRRAFLALASREPRRIKVIRVSGKSPAQVRDEAWKHIEKFL